MRAREAKTGPAQGQVSFVLIRSAAALAACLKVFLPMQFFCHCHRFVGGVSLPAAAAVARCMRRVACF